MGSPALRPIIAVAQCEKCGSKLGPADKFCFKCGAHRAASIVSAKPQDFERHLKVAWSCLKDVERKVDEIRQAKEASDREVNEGTFRGTIAMTALQGRLEREFHESLNIASNSALTASQIDPARSIEVDGIELTPAVVLAGVCGLRADLKFALDRWDEALTLYNQALQYTPDNPAYLYNIAATHTNKHEPVLAVEAFEKVVELDPTGELGIEATKNLQRLRAGSIGKKSFTGSWKVVAVFGGLTLLSFFVIAKDPVPGVLGLMFWGGILALYCRIKYR